MFRRRSLALAALALLLLSGVPPLVAGEPGPHAATAPEVASGGSSDAHAANPLTLGHTSEAKHVDVTRLPHLSIGVKPSVQTPLKRDAGKQTQSGTTGSAGAATSPAGPAVAATAASVGATTGPGAFPAATGPATVLILDSDPGDWIGAGQYQTIDGSTATFTPFTSGGSAPSAVGVSVTQSGVTWGAGFAAPPGQALAVGSYTGAVRAPFNQPGQPGLDVSGDGRGCNTVSGSFTVEDLALATDGTVLAFAATFVQYCGNGGVGPALYGEVRYNSTVGWAAKQISPSALDFGTVTIGTPISLTATIASTGTVPLTIEAGSFTVAPSPSSFVVTGGSCVSSTVDVTLAPLTSCTVTVTADTAVVLVSPATVQFIDNTARGGGNMAASATFTGGATINVSVLGLGSGTVTSSPPGINCGQGGTDCSARFVPGSAVTLTATTLGNGRIFDGWRGACSGTGPCTLTPPAGTTTVEAWFEWAPSAAALTGTPTLQSSSAFAGGADVTGCGSTPCVEPPDPWIAVGPTDIVESTSVSIRISDRSGTLLTDVSLPDFFGEPLGQVVDGEARMVWDNLAGRWLATEVSADCSNGYIYLAVSDSADPMSGWSVYGWSMPGAMYDFPGLGLSSDKIVISANIFGSAPCGSASYQGAELIVVDAASLIAEPSNLPWGSSQPNPNLFTWSPAVSLSPGSDLPLVVGSIWGQELSVGFARVTGTLAGNDLALSAVTTSDYMSLPPFLVPPAPRAFVGAGSDPLDARPLDALAQNGVMWLVSGTPCTPIGDTAVRSCVRITGLSASSGAPVMDFALGQAGYDTFDGGVGLTAGGSLMVVWSQSSATSLGPISTYATYSLTAPPTWPIELRAPTLLASGTGTYAGQRWGDYVGVAQDPTDPRSVWVADAISTASGGWTTRVAKLTQTETAPPAAPTGVSATPGNGQALVSWTAPADDGGSPITGYTVTSSPDFKTCTTSGATTCIVTGLTAGRTYSFTVTAHNGVGTGLPSTSAPVLIPLPGATYHVLTPARVLDSRIPLPLSATRFHSQVKQTITIATVDSHVPTDAVAVTGNVTVVGQTYAGYVAVAPSLTSGVQPLTSTINFPYGDARANGVTVPLASGGKLDFMYWSSRTSDTVQVIFDVTGYFGDAN